MAENERVANCRKACISAGVNTITSFEDGTAESILCTEMYELVVESEITLHRWKFAKQTLNLKLSLLVGVPDTQFNTAYKLPNGVLSVDTVTVNDRPIEYGRYQNEIHTNDSADDDVIVEYRVRADETLWNPYFTLLVVYRMATLLSFSISRKVDIAQVMKELADQHWKLAKTENSQSQSNQRLRLGKLKRARGGRIDKFWRDR